MKMVITLLAKLKALKQFYKRFTDLCNNLCVLEKMLPMGHSFKRQTYLCNNLGVEEGGGGLFKEVLLAEDYGTILAI